MYSVVLKAPIAVSNLVLSFYHGFSVSFALETPFLQKEVGFDFLVSV